MKIAAGFVCGFVVALLLVLGFFKMTEGFAPRKIPAQVAFDSKVWRESDSRVRATMYKDVVRYLETERPTKAEAEKMLGPSGYSTDAYLNNAKYLLVYHIDTGQRLNGEPYLDKLGVAFGNDGRYSHSAVWD